MLYILKIYYWNDDVIELKLFTEEDLQDIYKQLDNKYNGLQANLIV